MKIILEDDETIYFQYDAETIMKTHEISSNFWLDWMVDL